MLRRFSLAARVIDDLVRNLVEANARAGTPALETLGPLEARLVAGVPRAEHGHGPAMHAERRIQIPSTSATTLALVELNPSPEPLGVLVYLHGGGWMLGSAEAALPLARHIAAGSGWSVLVIDYRLAPEHPYPAGLDDALAATHWVFTDPSSSLRTDMPWGILGESAGGNLAAAATLVSIDLGLDVPDVQVLISPVLDSDLTRPSYRDPEMQHILPTRTMAWFWEQYVRDPALRTDWRVAPARATHLVGLPPTMLMWAENEIFRDEIAEFGLRLAAHDVEVEVHEMLGQAHGYFTALNILPASLESVALVASRLRRVAQQRSNA